MKVCGPVVLSVLTTPCQILLQSILQPPIPPNRQIFRFPFPTMAIREVRALVVIIMLSILQPALRNLGSRGPAILLLR